MINLIALLLLMAFPALVIVAGLRDLTSFTIPNWISAALALAFAPAALAAGLSFGDIGLHLGVGLAGFAAAVAMFALGWIGGGDAKLFAAATLWLGWPAAGLFTLVTGLAGGALAVGLLGARSSFVRAQVSRISPPSWALRLLEPGGPAPYGVAIAFGGLFAFAGGDMVAALNARM